MERNWGELLHLIYTEDEEWRYYKKDPGGIADEEHPLVQNTDLTLTEARAALSFLERHNLVTSDDDAPLELTKKGFEVAREREYQRSQVQQNFAIMLLTAILAVGAITQAFAAANIHPLLIQIALIALLALLLGVVIGDSVKDILTTHR